MMIARSPTEEQRDYAKRFLEEGSIGNRGVFDGDQYQQLFGLIGQIIVTDLLGLPRPKNTRSFDGGNDFMLNGKKWDVKVLIGCVPHKKRFVNNLNAWQAGSDCDGYVFLYYDKSSGTYTICGWITKDEFKRHAELFPAGSQRPKSDGTFMVTRNPMYEIKNSCLNDFETIKGMVINNG